MCRLGCDNFSSSRIRSSISFLWLQSSESHTSGSQRQNKKHKAFALCFLFFSKQPALLTCRCDGRNDARCEQMSRDREHLVDLEAKPIPTESFLFY